jgi:hypothetical protein
VLASEWVAQDPERGHHTPIKTRDLDRQPDPDRCLVTAANRVGPTRILGRARLSRQRGTRSYATPRSTGTAGVAVSGYGHASAAPFGVELVPRDAGFLVPARSAGSRRRSRSLSRDRTRCPRCPASRCTTRCSHRQAVLARVPRQARPIARIRPEAWPGALHPRARCRPARQDGPDS